ncbi:MAG: hypothetical protein K6T85_06745, partial [Gorillibacterium sp.]|nr:hypothetical protein [Gorillibacterium sp.]
KRSGLPTGSPLAFGESHIKSRIKNIITYKKPAFWVIAVTLLLTAVLIVAFTANPKVLQSPVPTRVASNQVNAMQIDPEQTANLAKIEAYLAKIMSSPGFSSNPGDYINAHQSEYQSIIGMGDEALQYFLAHQFETDGFNNGLRGHIIMSLRKDLLEIGSNTTAESVLPKS